MTVSVSVVKSHDLGLAQLVIADVTFDSSYLIGGESLTGALFGMRLGQLMHVQGGPSNGYHLSFDANADGTRGLARLFRTPARNCALTSGALAIGSGSKKKVKIASTVTFLLDGAFKSKTTAEVAFTATTMDIAPDGATVQEAVYALSLDGSGTATITMGAIATGTGNAKVPAIPKAQALIGYVRIAVAAGATPFDATSDDLDAAHLTVTYTDAALPPDGGKALGAITEGEQSEVKSTADLSGLTVRVAAWGR